MDAWWVSKYFLEQWKHSEIKNAGILFRVMPVSNCLAEAMTRRRLTLTSLNGLSCGGMMSTARLGELLSQPHLCWKGDYLVLTSLGFCKISSCRIYQYLLLPADRTFKQMQWLLFLYIHTPLYCEHLILTVNRQEGQSRGISQSHSHEGSID